MQRPMTAALVQRRGFLVAAIATALAGAVALIRRLIGSVGRGRLAASDLETLVTLAQDFIGLAVEDDHYRRYFAWRAEHDREAGNRYGRVLALLPGYRGHPARQQLLDAAARDARSGSYLADLRGEVLALFADTDAWVHLGYPAWPGTARGFADLDRPLSPAER
jgi:hypothetical protein